MPVVPTLPVSLVALLTPLRRCFTRPGFETFCAMVVGFLAQTGEVNVCGMLSGAGLGAVWHHSRAHRFFSSTRWSVESLGLSLLVSVVDRLVPAGEPLRLVVDDTLFTRSGRQVFGAAWNYDGSAKGSRKTSFGNCFVVTGIVVRLPFCDRPVCLPVLASLWTKGHSKVAVARTHVERIAEVFPGRRIDVTADAAYASRELKELDERITWTTRLRRNAVLFGPAPRRTGRPGRPRTRGERVGSLEYLAGTLAWTTREVDRYGKQAKVEIAHRAVLWPTPFGTRIARVVLVREAGHGGFDVALVTTDIDATAPEIVERYATRWSIEVAFEEAKQLMGTGDARNRTENAVRRTVPFGLLCQSLLWLWYSDSLHSEGIVEERKRRQPWYRSKTTPSTSDMLATARRCLIRTRFRAVRPSDLDQREFEDLLVDALAAAS